jgi:hypothetical protein
VNCDGQTESDDAALVLQYDAELVMFLQCFSAGDINNDGRVNSVDAALILQRVAGLLSGS